VSALTGRYVLAGTYAVSRLVGCVWLADWCGRTVGQGVHSSPVGPGH
jgi:hypothetical protein